MKAIHIRVGTGSDQTGETYCGRSVYAVDSTMSEGNAHSRDGKQLGKQTCKVCLKAYDANSYR